jgi:hypothetical protein
MGLHRLRAGLQGVRVTAVQSARTTHPFAGPTALYRLSKLSVWWLRLGIQIERIQPGRPQQNRRHERMHLTLKREATKPAADNVLQQQARFDAFVTRYNEERPHAALDMQVPASRYTRSPRPYRGLEDLTYPFHDLTVTGHALRPDLFSGTEDQSEPRLRRTEPRRDAGRRARLACELYAVRSRLLRRRDHPGRADREPIRPEVLPMSPE